MFTLLVFEGGLSPNYVADEAEIYELRILAENVYKHKKDSWEQARMMACASIQANSIKKVRFVDIMKFPWDSAELKASTAVNEEDATRLNKKASAYLESLKKK